MKTVLITGSSKGLGKSLAFTFAKNGFQVILHGRDEQRTKEVQRELLFQGREGWKYYFDYVIGDMTSEKTINKLYEIAKEKDIDMLINNAGIYIGQWFHKMTFEEISKMIAVNLIAPMYLTAKIYPLFLAKKSGLIVNINSLAGKIPNEMEVVYCASKHGLAGFSKSLKIDANKNGIGIIDIYLGAMATPMSESRPNHPKFINPDEAAELIFKVCEDYQTMRISETEITRRKY